jgi:hypothetical protein
MKSIAVAIVLSATAAVAQVPVAQVATDARVLDRVAELSKHDLPRDLLRRIVNEDIELLRGRRGDGTYQYATHERLESGRSSESFSVDPLPEDKLAKVEVQGAFVYRLVIGTPSRRMVVTKNRPVWVDRVEIESIPEKGTSAKSQVVPVRAWLEPGGSRTIDFDTVGRQTTVRVFARSDKAKGYGNIVLTLIEAKVFDLPDSPYADALASEKAILKAIDAGDIGSIRAMAQRIAGSLQGASQSVAATPGRIDVVAPAAGGDLYPELQAIEDLLTGTEAERREGLDRLHQLIRQARPRP